MASPLIGRKATDKKTGETGIITKVINRCLWVLMPDGTTISGGQGYWQVQPARGFLACPICGSKTCSHSYDDFLH